MPFSSRRATNTLNNSNRCFYPAYRFENSIAKRTVTRLLSVLKHWVPTVFPRPKAFVQFLLRYASPFSAASEIIHKAAETPADARLTSLRGSSCVVQPLAAADTDEQQGTGGSSDSAVERQQQQELTIWLREQWKNSLERKLALEAVEILSTHRSSKNICMPLLRAQVYDFFAPVMNGGCRHAGAVASDLVESAATGAPAAGAAVATAAAVEQFLEVYQHPVLAFISEENFLALRLAEATADRRGGCLLVSLAVNAAAAAAASANANKLAGVVVEEQQELGVGAEEVSSSSPAMIAAYDIFGVSEQLQQRLQREDRMQQAAALMMKQAQHQVQQFYSTITSVTKPFCFALLDGVSFGDVLESFGVYATAELPAVIVFSPVFVVDKKPSLAFFQQQRQQSEQQSEMGWGLSLMEPAFYLRDRWRLTLESLEGQLQQDLEHLQQHAEGYDWWREGTWLRRIVGQLIVLPLRRPAVEFLYAGVYSQVATAVWVACCLLLALIVGLLVCCNICDWDALAVEAAAAASDAANAAQWGLSKVRWALHCRRRRKQEPQLNGKKTD
ncbi:hypothetical protein cyc_00914 [Cyclospora cayetanensis]|uniref:Transmembrane protein n=1 Tax=Cyclospora cayetanensis TaxID=88456 RepID=A0A1D3D4X4_9EIME|nr:hypothetical protein cyc_00914 [Cyclospora cayetanensis]